MRQTLDKIVKLELLEKENAETIHKIWTEYHADKDCITASIPASVYGTLYQNSLKYPMVSGTFLICWTKQSPLGRLIYAIAVHFTSPSRGRSGILFAPVQLPPSHVHFLA